MVEFDDGTSFSGDFYGGIMLKSLFDRRGLF